MIGGPGATAPGRRRTATALLGALAALAAVAALALAPGARAGADIAGTWSCCGATSGAAEQDWVITAGTSALAGKGVYPPGSASSGQQFATITGSLSGDRVKIVTTYTVDKGYVATFTGTLSADGRTITGTWVAGSSAPDAFTATLSTGAGGGATPTPVLGQSVAAAPISGAVLVEKPGTSTYVPLSSAGTLPVGTIVDATSGRVALTAAGAGGTRHTGQFHGGEFRLGQARSGLTDLTLTGGAPCAGAAAGSRHRAAPRRQQLWGAGHGGAFETTGTYAAATVLGTRWLTQDTCTATIVRVLEGEVRVTDLVTHRTVVIRAPGSYTASG